jgi:hypothetical protein
LIFTFQEICRSMYERAIDTRLKTLVSKPRLLNQ